MKNNKDIPNNWIYLHKNFFTINGAQGEEMYRHKILSYRLINKHKIYIKYIDGNYFICDLFIILSDNVYLKDILKEFTKYLKTDEMLEYEKEAIRHVNECEKYRKRMESREKEAIRHVNECEKYRKRMESREEEWNLFPITLNKKDDGDEEVTFKKMKAVRHKIDKTETLVKNLEKMVEEIDTIERKE